MLTDSDFLSSFPPSFVRATATTFLSLIKFYLTCIFLLLCSFSCDHVCGPLFFLVSECDCLPCSEALWALILVLWLNSSSSCSLSALLLSGLDFLNSCFSSISSCGSSGWLCWCLQRRYTLNFKIDPSSSSSSRLLMVVWGLDVILFSCYGAAGLFDFLWNFSLTTSFSVSYTYSMLRHRCFSSLSLSCLLNMNEIFWRALLDKFSNRNFLNTSLSCILTFYMVFSNSLLPCLDVCASFLSRVTWVDCSKEVTLRFSADSSFIFNVLLSDATLTFVGLFGAESGSGDDYFPLMAGFFLL